MRKKERGSVDEKVMMERLRDECGGATPFSDGIKADARGICDLHRVDKNRAEKVCTCKCV